MSEASVVWRGAGIRCRGGLVEVTWGSCSYLSPGTRAEGPGRVVTWRKCQVTELVRELAQTGWREAGALSTCKDPQREEVEVEMSLQKHQQSSWVGTCLKVEYKMSYANMSPLCISKTPPPFFSFLVNVPFKGNQLLAALNH